MLFQKVHENGGWIVVDYSTTWKYGYEFMLDAGQELIESDFGKNLKRVAFSETAGKAETELLEEVEKNHRNLRECPSLAKENGVLFIAGNSAIMEMPLQFVFFNQTNHVRIYCPSQRFVKEHGEHVFDNYMNSIEIKAYVRSAERHVERKYDTAGLPIIEWPSAKIEIVEEKESPEEE